MRNSTNQPFFSTLLCSGALLASLQLHALADDEDDADHDQAVYVSSGQKITPTAAPRSILQPLNPGLPDLPDFVASGGISSVVSPDQKTLLILTSGYNLLSDKNGKGVKADSEEYVFVYDISSGTPVKKQVLKVPNTFLGIAFNPNGQRFYVGGGVNDAIHTFTLQSDGSWAEVEALIALGHHAGVGLQSTELPLTGGMDVTADGNSLVVANVYNDSISVVDLNAHAVAAELDLRPGKIDPAQNGIPGGEYPLGVAVKGNNTAYISSLRDREVDVVSFGTGQANLKARIKIDGNPNKLILDRSQTRLYVAADNSDDVSVVDTGSNQVVGKIHTVGPDWLLWRVRPYHGAAPNSLALSPDGRVLYVTDGGLNSVAVIRLDFNSPKVVGLVPTGFYPNAVSLSGDGQTLYVVNGKSVTGPNPTYLPKTSPTRDAGNQYILQLEKSSLLSFPVPDSGSLEQLTLTVAANNSLITRPYFKDARVMRQLQERIKHVIYIVKEGCGPSQRRFADNHTVFPAPTERTPSSDSASNGHGFVATMIGRGLEGCGPSQPRRADNLTVFPAPTERTPFSSRGSASNGHGLVATMIGRDLESCDPSQRRFADNHTVFPAPTRADALQLQGIGQQWPWARRKDDRSRPGGLRSLTAAVR